MAPDHGTFYDLVGPLGVNGSNLFLVYNHVFFIGRLSVEMESDPGVIHAIMFLLL